MQGIFVIEQVMGIERVIFRTKIRDEMIARVVRQMKDEKGEKNPQH